MNINLQAAALLCADDIVTVVCSYASPRISSVSIARALRPPVKEARMREYTYVARREFAQQLQPGDFVVVNNTAGLAVTQVVQIHSDCEIDPTSELTYRWIFQKVDIEHCNKLETFSRDLTEALRKKRTAALRKQFIEMLSSGDLDGQLGRLMRALQNPSE